MSQDDNYKIGISKRLKAVARANKLSQRAFASELGCSTTNMNRYWNAWTPPPAELLSQICDKYNVDPGWLLTGRSPAQGMEANDSEIDSATTELLDKARIVLKSESEPVVSTLTQNINTFFEIVRPAGKLTNGQAFDLVAERLVFVCRNPACGKDVGSFAARDELSDICPFCGAWTHAKTFAEQIEAMGIIFHQTDQIKEVPHKTRAKGGGSAVRKLEDNTHK